MIGRAVYNPLAATVSGAPRGTTASERLGTGAEYF